MSPQRNKQVCLRGAPGRPEECEHGGVADSHPWTKSSGTAPARLHLTHGSRGLDLSHLGYRQPLEVPYRLTVPSYPTRASTSAGREAGTRPIRAGPNQSSALARSASVDACSWPGARQGNWSIEVLGGANLAAPAWPCPHLASWRLCLHRQQTLAGTGSHRVC
jgi:hypothetical protein